MHQLQKSSYFLAFCQGNLLNVTDNSYAFLTMCVYENKIKITIGECKNVLDIVICHLETDAYHSLNVCPVTDESSYFWFSDL